MYGDVLNHGDVFNCKSLPLEKSQEIESKAVYFYSRLDSRF
jgi:hypothetical protein